MHGSGTRKKIKKAMITLLSRTTHWVTHLDTPQICGDFLKWFYSSGPLWKVSGFFRPSFLPLCSFLPALAVIVNDDDGDDFFF